MLWHFFFESLAYIVAFRLYISQRQRTGDFLETPVRWNVIVAAVAGAAIGSKLLYLCEDPARTASEWSNLGYLLGGKTIVGALLGGTMAVEFMKWRTDIRRRTGDLFALPLAIGIAIGRMGCLLAGKQDDTYGNPTGLPWGIDLGDGVRRHPVQLYEMAAMLVLAIGLARIQPPRFAEGDRFRIFVLAYFSWRLLVDFLKPDVRFADLTVLQWACAAAVLWYSRDLWRIVSEAWKPKEALAHG
ncbi:MAG TPA: prolipoprotein diacylglyceryl transferase family protein [Bryobacteraceae bacterium]|nr:prolipoprotein diacylglyceryl transferase family protein [Bryobacteraceae bacterium]